MTVSRPPSLRAGGEVLVDGAAHTVTGLSGSRVWLVDVTGARSSVALAELLSTPGFRMVTRPPAALPPRGLLDSLPAEAVDQARWWEGHIIEVITGVPPEAGKGGRARAGVRSGRAHAAAAGAGQGRRAGPGRAAGAAEHVPAAAAGL
jgi:putative transposase